MRNNDHREKEAYERLVEALQKNEPKLKNPGELASEIMDSIKNEDHAPGESSVHGRTVNIFKLLLVAATVCLMLVFGIEEYVFYKKVKGLEMHAGSISVEKIPGPGLRNVLSLNAVPEDKILLDVLSTGKEPDIKLSIKTKLKLARLGALDLKFIHPGEYIRMEEMSVLKYPELLND